MMHTDSIPTGLPLSGDNAPSDIDVLLGHNGNAFWISLAILFVIYIFKYWAGKECESRDFIEFLLEIPIDVITILLTIIITAFCVKDRMNYGHYLFLFSLVIAGICTLIRRYALKLYNGYKSKGAAVFGLLLSELVIGIGWIWFVYFQIS